MLVKRIKVARGLILGKHRSTLQSYITNACNSFYNADSLVITLDTGSLAQAVSAMQHLPRKLQHITVQHNDGQFPSMVDSSVCQMLHATKGLRGLVLHWSAPTSPVLLQLHPHTTCLHVKLPKPSTFIIRSAS